MPEIIEKNDRSPDGDETTTSHMAFLSRAFHSICLVCVCVSRTRQPQLRTPQLNLYKPDKLCLNSFRVVPWRCYYYSRLFALRFSSFSDASTFSRQWHCYRKRTAQSGREHPHHRTLFCTHIQNEVPFTLHFVVIFCRFFFLLVLCVLTLSLEIYASTINFACTTFYIDFERMPFFAWTNTTHTICGHHFSRA